MVAANGRLSLRNILKYLFEILVCVAIVELHYFFRATKEIHSTSLRVDLPEEPESIAQFESYSAVRDGLAKEFKNKVRILCWVMTVPKNHWLKARHVKNTWGKRCNILLFMSSEQDERIPTIKLPGIVEGYNNIWTKTREAYRYVWENYKDQADWFLKADDDSYIVLENLRYLLSAYNTSEPLYFGHKFKAYVEKGYMQGGSGYVLSREATKRFVEIGLKNETLCPPQSWAEDVQICDCLAKLGCDGVDTRDAHGRDRFLPLELQYHVAVGVADLNWFWDVHPSFYHIGKGFNCCSDTAIGFHQLSPETMYVYDYLIYILNPYGIENIRYRLQSTPYPPPDAQLKEAPFPGLSEDDVKWSEALVKREEDERKKISLKEEEAHLLDSNETIRNESWKKMNENNTSSSTPSL